MNSTITTTNEFDIFDHPSAMFWLREYCKEHPYAFCFLTSIDENVMSDLLGSPISNQGFLIWKTEYFGIKITIKHKKEITTYNAQYLGEQDKYLLDKRFGNYLVGFLQSFAEKILHGE